MTLLLVIALTLLSFLTRVQSVIPSWALERFDKISNQYLIGDYTSPEFLESDFSGYKNSDVALLVERKKDQKRGLI